MKSFSILNDNLNKTPEQSHIGKRLKPVHTSCEWECDTNFDDTNSQRINRSGWAVFSSYETFTLKTALWRQNLLRIRIGRKYELSLSVPRALPCQHADSPGYCIPRYETMPRLGDSDYTFFLNAGENGILSQAKVPNWDIYIYTGHLFGILYPSSLGSINPVCPHWRKQITDYNN